MNVAFYDFETQIFHEHMNIPEGTPEAVRSLVPMVQLDAQKKGDNLQGIFLVAWDGKPKGYMSVFVLNDADQVKLTEPLLDTIKEKALKLSRKK